MILPSAGPLMASVPEPVNVMPLDPVTVPAKVTVSAAFATFTARFEFNCTGTLNVCVPLESFSCAGFDPL